MEVDSDQLAEDIAKINLWSRIANKVHLRLAVAKKITTFEDLFQLASKVTRKNYFAPGHGITVKVVSKNSALHSLRTVQSVVHKAIITSLTGSSEKTWQIDEEKEIISIFVHIDDDTAQIFVNTSGKSLHNRGYRLDT